MTENLSARETAGCSKQIIGLDALRVFAALIVVAVHFGFTLWAPGNNPLGVPTHSYDLLFPYTQSGWVGVQIFFVLSGFVIAYSAYSAQAMGFLRQRLVRLVPGLALCATFTAVFAVGAHLYPARLAFTLWRNSVIFRPASNYIDGCHWTLPIEMSFYLL